MTYLLCIKLDKDIRICVGKLGKLSLANGNYFYIGSARKGIKSRIYRHLSKKKNKFWHIDYLLSLNHARIKEIWTSIDQSECQMAELFYKQGYSFINRFGSSDCNCRAHLFFTKKRFSEFSNFFHKNGFLNATKDYF